MMAAVARRATASSSNLAVLLTAHILPPPDVIWKRIIPVSVRILDRGVVLFVYFAAGSTLRRCPYMSSSTYDTQLNSNNCMFFSIRRYSGMLIFQGRV